MTALSARILRASILVWVSTALSGCFSLTTPFSEKLPLSRGSRQDIFLQATSAHFQIDEDNQLSGKLEYASRGVESVAYELEETPTLGGLFVNANGTFIYTPRANTHGTDRFRFRVRSGDFVASAPVVIEIAPVNDPPVLRAADPFETDEDTSFEAEIGDLVFDPDHAIDELEIRVVQDPVETLDDILESLTSSQVRIQGTTLRYIAAENFNGVDHFKLVVSDGESFSDEVEFEVNVRPVNDPPRFGLAVPQFSIAEDEQNFSIALLANDAETEFDHLVFSVSSNPAHGTASIQGASLSYVPNANFNGTDTFNIQVDDPEGAKDELNIEVIVTPVDDPPVAANALLQVAEDTPQTSLFTAADIDSANLVFEILNGGTNGSTVLTGNALGEYTYSPNANFTGNDTIEFRVTADGKSSDGQINVSVVGSNDPPQFAQLSTDIEIDEDDAFSLNLSATDSDSPASALRYSITVQPTQGSASVDPQTGAFNYTPDADYHGADSLSLVVSDGIDASPVLQLNFTVLPVDDAPVASDGQLNVIEDTAKTGEFSATDKDSTGLVYRILNGGAHGATVLTGAKPAEYQYTPNANYTGADTIEFEVTADGKSDTGTIQVTISEEADAPVFTLSGTHYSGPEDNDIVILLTATDADTPAQDLRFSVTGQPVNGQVGIIPETGRVTYRPTENFFGSDSIRVQVSDGGLSSPELTLNLTITSVNDVPQAVSGTLEVNENSSNNIGTLVGTDLESQTSLTFLKESDPAHGTVTVQSNGSYTYQPNANYFGADSFLFRVSDGEATSESAEITISVLESNNPPVPQDMGILEVIEGQSIQGQLSVNDPDDPLFNLRFTKSQDPAHGTLHISSSGIYNYTANTGLANYPMNDSFVYAVTDGGSAPVTHTVQVRILSDDPAVLSFQGDTDFGDPLFLGSVLSRTFTVQNSGGAARMVLPSFSNEFFQFAGGSYPGTGGDCTETIAASSSCTLEIEFLPSQAGTMNSELNLDFNGTQSARLQLIGEGGMDTLLDAEIFDSGGPYSGLPNTLVGRTEIPSGSIASRTTGTASLSLASTAFSFLAPLLAAGDPVTVLASAGFEYTNNDTKQFLRLSHAQLGSANAPVDSFANQGFQIQNHDPNKHDYAMASAIQTDGRIITAGHVYDGATAQILLTRYNTDGSLDANFGNAGKQLLNIEQMSVAYDVAMAENGKFYVAGYAFNGKNFDMLLSRHLPDGSLDLSFRAGFGYILLSGGHGNDYATRVLPLPQDHVLLAGRSYSATQGFNAIVVRFEPDGSLAASRAFDEQGVHNLVQTMEMDPEGMLMLGGRSLDWDAAFHSIWLTRIDPTDLSNDASFNSGLGAKSYDLGGTATVHGSTLDGQGRIIVAASKSENGATESGFFRLFPDGSIDIPFGGQNSNGHGYCTTTYQPDQLIVQGHSYRSGDSFALYVSELYQATPMAHLRVVTVETESPSCDSAAVH